jgi:hypothetical protein
MVMVPTTGIRMSGIGLRKSESPLPLRVHQKEDLIAVRFKQVANDDLGW